MKHVKNEKRVMSWDINIQRRVDVLQKSTYLQLCSSIARHLERFFVAYFLKTA